MPAGKHQVSLNSHEEGTAEHGFEIHRDTENLL